MHDETQPNIPLIAFLSDFGLRDSYVGQVKAAIDRVGPAIKVIDLTHDVPTHDIIAGATILGDSVTSLRDGAAVLAVVDPGVGSQRRAIAVKAGPWTFVGPDNGLLTEVFRQHQPVLAVELTNSAYHRNSGRDQQPTFFSRDVFGPVAAHLAVGTALDKLGPALEPTDLVRLDLPQPVVSATSIRGRGLYADTFGNIITNIRACDLATLTTHGPRMDDAVHVTLTGPGQQCELGPLLTCYSNARLGQLLGYVGSFGRLEIGIRQGRAIDTLGGKASQVEVVVQ